MKVTTLERMRAGERDARKASLAAALEESPASSLSTRILSFDQPVEVSQFGPDSHGDVRQWLTHDGGQFIT